MYRVLIADDDYEDRELLKLEISRALKDKEDNLKFVEAVSVRHALEMLRERPFDLLTLDIEFDRLNEGLEALPEIFDAYPALNIIVISGKLDKGEVTAKLFQFTRDNVLKGKRWARHFDVLDKKDDKSEAIRAAYGFALKQADSIEKFKGLFSLAEIHMEKGEVDKCMDVYRRIQEVSPGEHESGENLRVLKGGGYEEALSYLRRGDKVVAGLLLGHFIENRLKTYTRKLLGRYQPALNDCLKELVRKRRISQYKRDLFKKLINIRNKSMHHPDTVGEREFESAKENFTILEANI